MKHQDSFFDNKSETRFPLTVWNSAGSSHQLLHEVFKKSNGWNLHRLYYAYYYLQFASFHHGLIELFKQMKYFGQRLYRRFDNFLHLIRCCVLLSCHVLLLQMAHFNCFNKVGSIPAFGPPCYSIATPEISTYSLRPKIDVSNLLKFR
jgi:hypothetical protein